MDSQIDTAQQVAELVSEIYNRVDGRGRLEGSALAEALDVARHALQQARRDALAEAVRVAREFKGGFTLDVFSCKLIPDKDGPWTLGTDIADALDRLREGVQ